MEKGVLGTAIRTARIKMNLTQEQVAEMVDISPVHYMHLESEHRMPSIKVLFKLCDILNLSLDSLMFLSANDTPLIQEINNYAHKCTDRQLQVILAAMQVMVAQNAADTQSTES
ncbi:MAG: helix-turn-helix transcriptional regulator [Lachnospiraceae bacterium]|jgi:transcriptional regulator with XRE-family HTH domain|nr:helix-turn-helix transcriptional regulator [Lachnospiraceae bacterium]HBV82758.1 XRE family transcriptional regulator [Lachnospiraceae bacterium]